MRLRKEPAIQVKSPEQIERMYAAGQVVARTLTVLKEAVRPGVTTAELDVIAEREIRAAGAVPSFLGYFGFPASIYRLRCHLERMARRFRAVGGGWLDRCRRPGAARRLRGLDVDRD
jgi:hypothetical protein